ncbi:MAG: glycosyltransferase family 2 protein [Phycisphaerales bacterium]|nr:glycosyltransferase family 2 protein [Phycisphaerales bacterium]
MSSGFLVAIPVFNEEAYLSEVVREVRRYASEILVVDDGSTDATPRLLARERLTAVVRHPENRGYGASLASAFCYARRHGYRWLITMDCDGQHEPSLIPAFEQVAAGDAYDIISGSRYLEPNPNDDQPPADRRAINGRITRMLNERLRMSLTDAFCGFKAYRVGMLNRFRVTVPGYAMPLQFWVQAWRAGLRIVEVPVRLIYNDPNRYFGGHLDDADSRLAHYVRVFETELGAAPVAVNTPDDCELRTA